jgi:hypothetical protein
LRWVPHRTLNSIKIKLKSPAANLMDSPAGITVIGKGMVQAAEHHTPASQSL